MYDCDLTNIDLPSTGKLNGMVLTNQYDRLNYMRSLDDDQLIKFVALIEKQAYDLGMARGEKNILEDLDLD